MAPPPGEITVKQLGTFDPAEEDRELVEYAGRVALMKGDIEAAVPALRWAIELGADRRVNLAYALARDGREQEAIGWLLRAARTEGVVLEDVLSDAELGAVRQRPDWPTVLADLKECAAYWGASGVEDHALVLPKDYVGGPVPTMVWFHGWGDCATSYADNRAEDYAAEIGVAVLCVSGPSAYGPKSYEWSDDPDENLARYDEAVTKFAGQHDPPFEPELGRTGLGGFSQGAVIAAELFSLHPTRFSGAIVLSPGFGNAGTLHIPVSGPRAGHVAVAYGAQEHPATVEMSGRIVDLLRSSDTSVTVLADPERRDHSFPENFDFISPGWVSAVTGGFVAGGFSDDELPGFLRSGRRLEELPEFVRPFTPRDIEAAADALSKTLMSNSDSERLSRLAGWVFEMSDPEQLTIGSRRDLARSAADAIRSGRSGEDSTLLLTTLTQIGEEGADAVAELADAGEPSDPTVWRDAFDNSWAEGSRAATRLLDQSRSALPSTGPDRAVAIIAAARLSRDNEVTHPFDSADGLKRLQEWVESDRPDDWLLAAETLSHLAINGADELLASFLDTDRLDKTPHRERGLAAMIAALHVAGGAGEGDLQPLKDLATRPALHLRAKSHLARLDAKDPLPEELDEPEFQATATVAMFAGAATSWKFATTKLQAMAWPVDDDLIDTTVGVVRFVRSDETEGVGVWSDDSIWQTVILPDEAVDLDDDSVIAAAVGRTLAKSDWAAVEVAEPTVDELVAAGREWLEAQTGEDAMPRTDNLTPTPAAARR